MRRPPSSSLFFFFRRFLKKSFFVLGLPKKNQLHLAILSLSQRETFLFGWWVCVSACVPVHKNVSSPRRSCILIIYVYSCSSVLCWQAGGYCLLLLVGTTIATQQQQRGFSSLMVRVVGFNDVEAQERPPAATDTPAAAAVGATNSNAVAPAPMSMVTGLERGWVTPRTFGGGSVAGGGIDDVDDLWSAQFAQSWPRFSDSTLAVLYRAYVRRHVLLFFCVPTLLIGWVLIATQFNLEHVYAWSPSSPPLLVACSVGVILVGVVHVLLSLPGCMRKCGEVALANRMDAAIAHIPVEEALLLTGLVSLSGISIARVVAGQCPAGTSAWGTQACNPYADTYGIPVNDLFLLMLLPILVQKCLKHVRFVALVVAWAIVTFVVCFNLAWAQAARSHYWTLLYLAILVLSSLEIERMGRVSFRHFLRGKVRAEVRPPGWLCLLVCPPVLMDFSSFFVVGCRRHSTVCRWPSRLRQGRAWPVIPARHPLWNRPAMHPKSPLGTSSSGSTCSTCSACGTTSSGAKTSSCRRAASSAAWYTR